MKDFKTILTTIVMNTVILFSTTNLYSQDLSEYYYQKGLEKFNERSFDSAIFYFNLVIEANPDNTDAYFRRGLSKDETGQINEAIEDYNKAISIQPKPVYLNNLAMINVRMGNFDKAMDLYNKAIDLDTNYLVAIYNKGRLYLEMENLTEGCYYMKKAYFKGLTVVEDAVNYFCN